MSARERERWTMRKKVTESERVCQRYIETKWERISEIDRVLG